ncbi:MAG: ferritin-like domain-containing protein [Actinomycetota bacterium]|nr:ferritin-like domain-containing protein [Actinomycetota bacterium]
MTVSKNLDRDAFARAARDPFSRRKFLALTGGTGAAATFLVACGDDEEEEPATSADTSTTEPEESGGEDPLAMFGEGDIGILNYALTLEFLEAGFYAAVIDSGMFKGADLELIKVIGAHEQEHVDALTATVEKLGEKPAPEPQAQFPLDDPETILTTAAEVENLGAAAYLGQAAAIENEDVLAAALSIHTVEARHAAVLNTLIGESPTPDGAFAVPADAEMVLEGVQPFLKS